MAQDHEPNVDSTDLELLARWRAGDERAATSLVARHAPALARFAVSLGQRLDVDEVVQDTFVRAFGSIDSFRADSSLRTWLFTIERRLILDRRRAARRRRDDTSVDDIDAATEFNPLDDHDAGACRATHRVVRGMRVRVRDTAPRAVCVREHAPGRRPPHRRRAPEGHAGVE